MKKKEPTTKNKILSVTIALLNERGISNVKMRDVSSELNISVGNLTYHYPKWETLIDDIFNCFKDELDTLYNDFPLDISETVGYINKIYNIQMRYSFLFSNFYTFFRLFPKYEHVKEAFFFERMVIMRDALKRLEEKGFLYHANEKHNYDLLVRNTWLLLSGWYGFSVMFKESSYAYTKEEFFLSIWNMYVYHLTHKGKSIVRRSFAQLKSKNFQ